MNAIRQHVPWYVCVSLGKEVGIGRCIGELSLVVMVLGRVDTGVDTTAYAELKDSRHAVSNRKGNS